MPVTNRVLPQSTILLFPYAISRIFLLHTKINKINYFFIYFFLYNNKNFVKLIILINYFSLFPLAHVNSFGQTPSAPAPSLPAADSIVSNTSSAGNY